MNRALAILALLSLVPAAALADETPDEAKQKQAAEEVRIEEVKIRLEESEDPFPELPIGPRRLNHRAFLKYLHEIAADKDVDAILLKLDQYGVGWARLLEVRDAIKDVRRAGKKVFVYKENLTTPDLILASVADRISMPESGVVLLPGIAIESWYMRELLAKLHLSFDVMHIGEYKSAGESFVRDTMSDELRETLDPLLDELYSSTVKAIAEGRGLSEDAVKKAIDEGLFTARKAKELGLIDRVEYEDQFRDGLKSFFPDKKLKKAKSRLARGGPKFDPNNPFAFVMLMMNEMFGAKEKVPAGPKIAVIYCSGMIVSGKSQYDWSGNIAAMGSETIVEAIDKARKDDDVKAVVIRINSPGGSALASDMIWRAIERTKAEKPVIASMGDVAASGGYYIACNSHAILAEPQTITGSIGVVGMVPNVDDFYTWVGINPQRMSRGKRAEVLATTKSLDDDAKEMMRGLLRSVYDDFVGKVAAGRGKAAAEIEPVARGRVWTGRDALARGLVDRIGGLDDAITLACARAGIEGEMGEAYHILEYPKRKGPLEFLEDMFSAQAKGPGLSDLAAAASRMPVLQRVLSEIEAARAVSRDGVCVINPELTGFAIPFVGAGR